MAKIKAPFNFVPLSNKVFFPDWADQISHDIPFSDGISGSIELKITAETPIFVRNGHTKQDAEVKNNRYKSFSKSPDGKYFIPATSIKGAIRNVLEIMSFGKMSQVANNRYSIRDLQLKKYLSFFQNDDVHCGWLTLNGDTATITDNGIPRRISHKDIDEKYGTDFCGKFADKDFLKSEDNRSPIAKYKMIGKRDLTGYFKERQLNPNNSVDKRIKVVFGNQGQEGTIVFTGQPGFRKPAVKNQDGSIRYKASGKFYEFVFLSKVSQTYSLDTEEEGGIYKDFCFIYKNSEEWKFWRKKMNRGESVPVFFSIKDGEISHFGLSYLYKLPYSQRIKDYLYEDHRKNNYDLAECIFGTTDKNKSLRGRVQFSNAFCEKGEVYSSEIAPYMGSPRPTYYPIYLKQRGNNGYMIDKNDRGVYFKTMLDTDAKLKGWKRYPVRQEWQTTFDIMEGQEKNTNPFYPLNKGAEFICTVRFHNLRKSEIGALLSAIDLNQGCFHSVGFAKAFGYGVSKIEIVSTKGVDLENIAQLKQQFLELMSDNVENYTNTPQIKEMYAMHRPQKLNAPLEYMDLKDFVSCKKQSFKEGRNQTFGEYLPWYSDQIDTKQEPVKQENKYALATVSVFRGTVKQAKLIEGKDKNKSLELVMENKKIKLKMGDKIKVRLEMKSGNIQRLTFIEKV